MLHSFRLSRIANMLENWHQMVGNWLETINILIHEYLQCMYEIVTILWFSMKLGVINSYLVVCFYNGFKSFQVREYLQISCKKILHNGYKTTFMEKCFKFTINTRENFTNYFFPQFD